VAKEQQNLVRTSLVAAIAEVWFLLISSDEALAALDGMISIQSGALATVEEQRAVGMATGLAVQQFAAELEGLRALRVEVNAQIVSHEAALNLLCGRAPGAVERGAPGMHAWELAALDVELTPDCLLNRPGVRMAEFELLATKADVEAARAAFLPRLSLGAGLGLEAFRSDLLPRADSFAYTLGGDLVGPVFNRAALKAELKIAEAGQAEALIRYRQELLTGLLEVDQQQRSRSILAEGLARKRQQVSLLDQAISTAQELFRSGRASYLELLTAQRASLESRLELVEWRRQLAMTSISLYKAVGGGTLGLDGRSEGDAGAAGE
jgi:outer membrane protein TolC